MEFLAKLHRLVLLTAVPWFGGCARDVTTPTAPSGHKDAGAQMAYRDDKVIAEVRPPAFLPLNVHGSETVFLTVAGKRYKNVKGIPPFYIDVPELDSVLFVTQVGLERVLIHFVNPKTGKEIKLDPVSGRFGGHIGQKPGSGFSEWVERVEGQELVLGSSAPNYREFFHFNLPKRKLDRIEELFLDNDGAVTNRKTYNPKMLR